MKTMIPLHIISERILLSPFKEDDADKFYAYRSLPEVCKYQGWHPKSVNEINDFISRQMELKVNQPGSWYQFAIRLNQNRENLIGDCGIHFPEKDNFQVEIGVTLAPKYQGFGFAREAVCALLDYIFNTLNKHRVFASIDPENSASIRMLRRLGFRKEAHFVKSLLIDDKWVDDVIYAMLREEWNDR
ncbi:MAG: GNAT family N-acetyltransferase [Marinifilaceae bacterium]|jgi:RimJ/RimL family protein N-acetyltransferase